MRARLYKIASIVAAVLVLLIFGYYLFTFNRDDVDTAKVTETVVKETVTAEGVFVRDEEVIYVTDVGKAFLLRNDGDKVSAGGILANVYESEQDVSRQLVAQRLENRLAILEKAVNTAQYASDEVEEIDARIRTLTFRLGQFAAKKNADQLKEIADEINYLLCRKQMLISDESQRIAAVEKLTQEYNELIKPVAKSTVNSIDSGYYISTADGYEMLFTTSSLDSLSPSRIQALLSAPGRVADNILGKIVKDYHIYFVLTVSVTDVAKITTGKALEIVFPFATETSYQMSVKKIIIEGENASVILEGTVVTKEFLSLRRQVATAVTSSKKGLRIDISAIRVKDGVVGVYAVRKGVLRFLPVEIVTTTDEYYVVKWNDSDEKTVMLSDEIVVSGRNLQEGRLVR